MFTQNSGMFKQEKLENINLQNPKISEFSARIAKKNEVSYAIANMTVFGIVAMLLYPYFANYYFESNVL